MGTAGTPLQYAIVCAVGQYHSNLSDHSASEIKVGLGLDLVLHYVSIFFTENNENEHLIFREFHGR